MNKNYNYKRLTPFKWFVLQNFPFIDEDFDAITNYQLFCKLGEEINKIINSQNTVGTQMENVTNAFIELQNYVNNYFDNLNVQDEINNKLNQMAEDGTLAKIINEDIFAELNNKINSNTEKIEKISKYPYFDVMKNGGFTDGNTPNDNIIINAKNQGYSKFYFSQNQDRNAIYYFNNIPNFNNCEIITDEDVKISLPNAFGNYNLNNGKYKTNINFIYRNQNQEALTPNNNSNLFNMLHMNTDYRLKNMISIEFNNPSIKMFHYKYNNDFLFEEVEKNNFYEENNLYINRKSNTQKNYFNGLCIPITENRNCIETCSNGNRTNMDYVLLNSNTLEGIFCSYNGSNVYVYYKTSNSIKTDRLNMFNHNLSANNDFTFPCQYKMRYLSSKNIVQFIFNNQIVGEYNLPFTPNYFGFGINSNNSDYKMMRFCIYQQDNLPLNYNLKILIVGDSRFAGDGQTYKIDEILKNGLLFNGINNVEIVNKAVSGYNIGQIYNVLNNEDLSQYDIIIYEGGINNYNSDLPNIAYNLSDTEILLNNSGALIIYTTCMPCGWGGTDAAVIPRAQKYYGIVNAMYVGLGSAPHRNNIIIDNNMGNQTSKSNLPVCSDGVHPNDLGLIEISRNIITALFNHYKI
jgi:hypothetical protein